MAGLPNAAVSLAWPSLRSGPRSRTPAEHELGNMLHEVGFKILKVSGRPEMPGVFIGSVSPRVLILCGKP